MSTPPQTADVLGPSARSIHTSGAVRTLDAFWQGCALLAAIQLPGALLDYFIRSDIGPPEILILVVTLLALLGLLLRRVAGGNWYSGTRASSAAVVAFGLAAGFAELGPRLMDPFFVETREGVLIPTPGRRKTDCRGEPLRCHEHVINELGFRGALVRRTTTDAKLVAFVGDSFVFGSGVGDGDTVPAAMARGLADLRPPVVVLNAGIEGLSGGNFPDVIAYIRERVQPDVIVVLFKDDDLDETDMLSRWNRFRRSFGFRFLYVINVEPVYETARQVWRYSFSDSDRAAMLSRYLDGVAAASAGTKVLLVTNLADDLQPTLRNWLALHLDVAAVTSWEHPRLRQVERIPADGHWNEAGCREVADVLLPWLRAETFGGRGSAEKRLKFVDGITTVP